MTLEELSVLLEAAGLEESISGEHVYIRCPFAEVSGHKHSQDRKPSLGMTPKNEEPDTVWQCFTCHRKGRFGLFLDLLESELNRDISKARAIFNEYRRAGFVVNLPPYEREESKEHYPTFDKQWKQYRHKTAKYVLDRRITIETCREWDLGLDTEQKRVMFPVKDISSRVVGAVGRATKQSVTLRYMNYWSRIHKTCGEPVLPKANEYFCSACSLSIPDLKMISPGFRKSWFLFGEQRFKKRIHAPTVIVSEGIFDALRVYQACPDTYPVAIFGSTASDEQVDKIVQFVGRQGLVIPLFDKDEAGWIGSNDLFEMLKKKVRVLKADYSVFKKGDDPGKLHESQIRQAIDGSKIWY